ncbi:MAG: peptidoglycan DD-metalloendopeptidase family protein [Sporolactobacillus sp.]
MSAYDDYKRRHSERKRRTLRTIHPPMPQGTKYPMNPYTRYESGKNEQDSPVAPKSPFRRFVLQICLSAALVFAVYEVSATNQASLKPIRQSVKTAMTQEFQFTAVSSWYEKNLGNPISFLPGTSGTTKGGGISGNGSARKRQFAEPVTGEVTAPYSNKSQGVTVKTTAHETVKAVQDGLVIFVGEKKKTGQTIIIQHKDHDESWYGELDTAGVKVYQEVKKGQKIGTTSGGKKGVFYFALKKGEKFIDPIQVMSFD